MTILGIDPGLSGGLAFLSKDGLAVEPMPVLKIGRSAELDCPAILRLIHVHKPLELVAIEEQIVMPKQGLSSTARTHRNLGILIGIVQGLELPMLLVRPARWKKSMGVPADKDGARLHASRIFPACTSSWARKKDDGLAEAALIAEFARRHLAL